MNRKLFWRDSAIILLVGTVALAVFHARQFMSGWTEMIGNLGDARFCTFVAEHLYAVFQGRASFFSPAYFFPIQGTLAYSDALVLHALPFSLLRLSGLGDMPAFTATIVILNAVTYLCAALFFRRGLRFSATASALGAALFVFNNPRRIQIGHPQLQPLCLLVLALWCFLNLLRELSSSRAPNPKTIAWQSSALAGLIGLQCWTAFYPAWFFILFAVFLLLSFAALLPQRKTLFSHVWKVRKCFIWPGLVAGLTMVPFLRAYLPVARGMGWRGFGEIKLYSPTFISYLDLGSDNFLWHRFQTDFIQPRLSAVAPESTAGLGIVMLSAWLAVVLLIVLRREHRLPVAGPSDEGRFITTFVGALCLAAFVFALFSLKTADLSLWRVIYEVVPGARAIRCTGRSITVIAIGPAAAVALLVHAALSGGWTSRGRRIFAPLALAIGLFGLAEQAGRGETFPLADHEPAVQNLTSKISPTCTAFYALNRGSSARWPTALQIDAMFAALRTGVPTVNGYSGQFPQGWDLNDETEDKSLPALERWRAQNAITQPICVVSP